MEKFFEYSTDTITFYPGAARMMDYVQRVIVF